MQISHEVIYAYIYVLPRGSLKKSLISYLRHGKRTCGVKPDTAATRERIPNMVSIHDRPEEIEGRQMPFRWEGDLIMGADNISVMGTDFNTVPEWVMQELQDEFNDRPRKVLDFDSPKQKFSEPVTQLS